MDLPAFGIPVTSRCRRCRRHVPRIMHQIPALAAGGFRAVAPDLRGYNESGRPRGVSCYSLNALAQDIGHLISGVAPEGAILVGHDWGGVIAWRLAAQRPELVRRLIILNAPRPAAW